MGEPRVTGRIGRRWAPAVLAAGAGLVLLAGCGWDVTSEEFSDDTPVGERVAAVRVANDAGSVRIRAGSSTSVHRTVHYGDDKPGATHRVEGDALVLEGCQENGCWVDYEVVVPEGTRVSGEVSSGDVEVEGAGAVSLMASSGNVSVRRVSGKVSVEASSGTVRLVDVGDSVAVEASSGDVTVQDVRGGVTVQSSSGTVRAHGVGGAAVVEATSGDVEVQLSSAQNVEARSSSGSITVTVPAGPTRCGRRAGAAT